MRSFVALFSLVLTLAISQAVVSQTPPCAETDYKCRLAAAEATLKKDPKNPDNYYNIALIFQQFGDFKRAVETYDMYVAIPNQKPELLADGYNNRGISLRALKKPEAAVADFNKAIELNPAQPGFLVNRANAYVDMKNNDLALADYAKAIAQDPKLGFAYSQRAVLLQQMGRNDDSIADLTKAIELDPANAEPFYNRGVAYSAKQDFPKAIADYDKYIAMATDPNLLGDAYMNRGVAYAYTPGGMPKAVEDFTKVIEFKPNWPNGYLARAMIYRELKKNDLAAADEKKAAELKK